MKTRGVPTLASLFLTCALAAPAMAGIGPYFRVDYGANQLRMSDGNALIEQNEAMFQAAGLPASFDKVGAGTGPSGSVGLWLCSSFRVGATYSYFRSILKNRLHVPGQVFFGEDLDFRMTEVGAEAVIRIRPLAGLMLGGNVARGHAEMIEGFAEEDFSGQYYADWTARRSLTTYGGFIGIDQTNASGVAGYIRVGYQVRDVGSIPSQGTVSDGFTTVPATSQTIPLDYGGVYVKVGVGFDLVR